MEGTLFSQVHFILEFSTSRIRVGWMASIQLDGYEFEQALGVMVRDWSWTGLLQSMESDTTE